MRAGTLCCCNLPRMFRWDLGFTKSLFEDRSMVPVVLNSPGLMYPRVKSKPAILISGSADRDLRRDVIFKFDYCTLRGGHVSGKGHEQVAGHALLNGYARTRVLLVAAKNGIDRELRNASNFFQTAGYLAADL